MSDSTQDDAAGAEATAEAADARPLEPFEALMNRLGSVVTELEAGDLPLERALVLFEEGVRLSRQGALRLDRAEARVEELLGRELRPIDPREPRSDSARSRT